MNGSKENAPVKVGSRKSELALIQTNYVINRLKKLNPQCTFETVTMTTTGDNILNKALSKIGEKSLFTKELETALEKKEVDFVVHSLKDLPTVLPPGMTIGAVCEREDPRDAVVIHPNVSGKTLCSLASGSVIGTSSLRRAAQLHREFPCLKIQSVRGNLNTRLKKLDNDNKYAALILASAGLSRMGWKNRISQVLDPDTCMYAVGQGALAVECREDDHKVLQLLEPLQHKETVLCCLAERAFLKTLGGGCSAPVAVESHLKGHSLFLKGGVWSLDGKDKLVESQLYTLVQLDDEPPRKTAHNETVLYCGISGGGIPKEHLVGAEKLGEELASLLVKAGAMEIIDKAKNDNVAE